MKKRTQITLEMIALLIIIESLIVTTLFVQPIIVGAFLALIAIVAAIRFMYIMDKM